MRYRKPFARILFFVFLLTCLLTGLIEAVRVPVRAAPQMLGTMEIIINEVAWAGTIASEDDDWIELFNPNSDTLSYVDISGWQLVSATGSLNITFDLGTLIYGNSYFLIETRELATSVPSDYISPYPWSLNDYGDIIRLRKVDGSIVDTVNEDDGSWPAGTLTSNKSMERYRPIADKDLLWTTYNGGDMGVTDASGINIVYGTPKSRNLAYDITPPTVTTITTDAPDPSLVGKDVNVSVTVTSLLSTPTGTVDITVQGSTPTCTITLSNGEGSCVLQFVSFGEKVIHAEYKPTPGDLDHASSSDTETHKVRLESKVTITPTSPDPTRTYQSVPVTVTVEGDTIVAPSGTVTITGTSKNCTISLSPTVDNTGTGSCSVSFYSAGSKVITATYNGDDRYSVSTDNEDHAVELSPTSTPYVYVYKTATPRPQPPPPLIAINEFVPRPGSDWNNDGVVNTNDEYIEILNHGVINVNLSGYKLDDEANIGSSPFSLPSITLQPGERIVFYGSQTGLLLSDGGDGVRLIKPNGQLMDAYNYSYVEFPDQAFCRLPDNGGLDDWNTNCYPTPGLRNSLSGSLLRPPTFESEDQVLCPIADSIPYGFFFAECTPFGNNIWNRFYWDKFGWYGGLALPNVDGKWEVLAD